MTENVVDGVVASATGSSVASRIFAVLDAFDGSAPALRLSVIAERTGLPMPSALRVVRELVAWGGLERQADGSYRLGRRLWVLGSGTPCERRIRRAAHPYMHELRIATGHDIQLAVRDGTSALLLDGPGVGDRLALHASAVGKVLLADAPIGFVDTLLRAGLPRLTPYSVDAPGLLARQLKRVRRSGVASDHQETSLGIASVASAVRDQSGATVAAIGIVATTPVDLTRYVPNLKIAVAATSRALTRAHDDFR